MTKTVFNVFLDKKFGFGDFIRGSICLAQLAKKYGLNLHIDLSQHPIQHYMMYVPKLEPTNVVEAFYGVNPEDTLVATLDKFISSSNNVLYVSTNFFYDAKTVTSDMKALVNSALQIKPEYHEKVRMLLPIQEYKVLHVRCSDENYIPMDKFLANMAKLSLDYNTMILSSDYAVKKTLIEQFGFFSIDNVPTHSAFSTDASQLESVIIDYIVLSKSLGTNCISFYGHGSGFSEQCSFLHNVPYSVTTLDQPEVERSVDRPVIKFVATPHPRKKMSKFVKPSNIIPTYEEEFNKHITKLLKSDAAPTSQAQVYYHMALHGEKRNMPTMNIAPVRRSFNIYRL